MDLRGRAGCNTGILAGDDGLRRDKRKYFFFRVCLFISDFIFVADAALLGAGYSLQRRLQKRRDTDFAGGAGYGAYALANGNV